MNQTAHSKRDHWLLILIAIFAILLTTGCKSLGGKKPSGGGGASGPGGGGGCGQCSGSGAQSGRQSRLQNIDNPGFFMDRNLICYTQTPEGTLLEIDPFTGVPVSGGNLINDGEIDLAQASLRDCQLAAQESLENQNFGNESQLAIAPVNPGGLGSHGTRGALPRVTP